MNTTIPDNDDNPSLLLVDDDVIFCQVLSRALTKRGFSVSVAHDADQAIKIAKQASPECAIVDLNMPGKSGLELVPKLKTLDQHTRIVVLTGYASIATAIEAIKLGAIHYLAKPADADEIVAAFNREEGEDTIPIRTKPMSVNRLEWEHLQKVLNDCGGNISKAARLLHMHRRTLQRKLNKRPVKE